MGGGGSSCTRKEEVDPKTTPQQLFAHVGTLFTALDYDYDVIVSYLKIQFLPFNKFLISN